MKLALFAAAGLAATALAQYNRPPAEKDFSKLDGDSNGHMHHHEVHKELDRKFDVRKTNPFLHLSPSRMSLHCVLRTSTSHPQNPPSTPPLRP